MCEVHNSGAHKNLEKQPAKWESVHQKVSN